MYNNWNYELIILRYSSTIQQIYTYTEFIEVLGMGVTQFLKRCIMVLSIAPQKLISILSPNRIRKQI